MTWDELKLGHGPFYNVHADPKGRNEQVGAHDNLNRAKKHAINLARGKPGSVYGVRGAASQLLGSFGPYRRMRARAGTGETTANAEGVNLAPERSIPVDAFNGNQLAGLVRP